MIESNKEERDIIFPILQQLDIDNKDPVILSQLMHGLGFENDVPFAKSLFSDTLTHIYKLHQYYPCHSEDFSRNFLQTIISQNYIDSPKSSSLPSSVFITNIK